MSFSELLNHTCDIYHIVGEDKSPGFGLPGSPSFSYPAEADATAVPCHFGVKSGTLTVEQAEPQAKLAAKMKLTLPIGTDVRLNDKVIDCATGYVYTAEIPRRIREHHIYVMLRRTSAQEAL